MFPFPQRPADPRSLGIWKSRNPHKRVPRIRNPEALLRLLEMRRKVLSQPLDLVYWDSKGNLIPAPLSKRNPQIGAVICRWAHKIGRNPPLPSRQCGKVDRDKLKLLGFGFPKSHTIRMDEYGPIMKDYFVTGGFPMELLPKSETLKTESRSVQPKTIAADSEPEPDLIRDSAHPVSQLGISKKRSYVPTNPSTWKDKRSVVFSAHSILRKR